MDVLTKEVTAGRVESFPGSVSLVDAAAHSSCAVRAEDGALFTRASALLFGIIFK